MGRKVVTVEPFYDNILRIHKASILEGFQKNITLIKNAIGNKANEIKQLYENKINIGGQGIINTKTDFKESDFQNNKYLVKTILFNDIVDYLPKNDKGSRFKKAIMKIDIEGFEPFAFEHAERLFDALEIQMIFMEWGNLPPSVDRHPSILRMIDFLFARGLVPQGDGRTLVKDEWKKWPWDIIWFNKSFKSIS